MDKITNIEYNKDYIKLEISNKIIYKIPNNNDYIKNLLQKGINENQGLEKDIKFYDNCANICIYPTWIALGFLVYGVISKFILLDLILILAGGMAGISLVGTAVFKIMSHKSENKANNNKNFIKIYEYAKNGGRVNNLQSNNTKQDIKNSNHNQMSSTNKNNYNYNNYHLNREQIIQDEEVHQRKR